MSEKFEKLNDYTLEVRIDMSPKTHRPESYELGETAKLRRIFNFRAAQVTTIMQQSAYIASDYSSEGGAGVTAASQMNIQNFDDIQSQFEIELMHKKLCELGGKPPSMEQLRGGPNKKPGLGGLRNS